MTFRKYPRTLNEAFPNTMEYGASIEKPYYGLPLVDKVIITVSVLALVVVALDVFFWSK
jgi:hypothetical protein